MSQHLHHTLPFTIRQIQYAIVLRQVLSFRKAAALCHVAQPSLSISIAQLEAQVGMALFERERHSVRETRAGTLWLDAAERLLRDAQELQMLSQQLLGHAKSSVVLGIIPTMAPYLLPKIVSMLRIKYPGLQIRWVEEKTHVCLDKLIHAELDAVLWAEAHVKHSELSLIELGEDPFVAISSKPWTQQQVTMKEFLGAHQDPHQVLLLDEGHCLRDQALSFCKMDGMQETPFRATSLSTLVQMLSAATTETTVTFLPKLCLELESSRARFFQAEVEGHPHRMLSFAFRRTHPFEGTLKDLGHSIRSKVSELQTL